MSYVKRTDKRNKSNKLKAVIFMLPILLVAFVLHSFAQDEKFILEEKEPEQEDAEMSSAGVSDPNIREMNILLIGTDRRDTEYGLADTLMVANYRPETNRINLISFMRDTYVDIPAYGMQKLNAAHAFGGPELVRETLYENFGIQTDYYASVDFNGFPNLMDLIIPHGIEIDIPYDMSHGIGMTLEQGKQVLHGDQLLGYARFRHDRKSDFGRVERQQEIMSAIKTQGMSFQSLLNLPKIFETVDTYIDTDMDKRILFSIGKSLIQNESNELETLRIPDIDAFTEEHKHVGQVLVPDLEANRAVLDKFLLNDL